MLKFRYLTYSNFGLIEKWYMDMAKKGWQIEKTPLPFVHKFIKSKPENAKYKIAIAPNESVFSAFSKDELEDFANMAEDFGWHFIDRSFNMNLYKIDEAAEVSLYNDTKEELQILYKSIKGEIASLSINSIIIALLAIIIFANFNSSEIYYSNYTLFMMPAIFLLFLFTILSLVDYIAFKRRNKDIKNVKNLKYSKLSFSKAFILLLFLPIVLVLLAFVSGFIFSVENPNKMIFLLSMLPIAGMFILIYWLIKKIKVMNIKKRRKILLSILMLVLITISTNIFTFSMLNNLTDKDNHYNLEAGNFLKKPGRRSILTESCDYYSSEKYNLQITRTVARSKSLATDLFRRIIKNGLNHPYRAEFVKDISESFPYSKTYSLANENNYLILFNKVVLEINGNLKDEEIQKEIEKLLE